MGFHHVDIVIGDGAVCSKSLQQSLFIFKPENTNKSLNRKICLFNILLQIRNWW